MSTAAAPQLPKPNAPEPDGELRMSLSEHLGELRKRLLKCVMAVLVLGVLSLVFAKQIYGWLMRPVLLALPPESSSLVYTSAIEEINVYMKVGLYSGVFLSTPVILYQLWAFVSPGLYQNEKRLAKPFVVLGTLAFIAGASFCYFVLLPTMFQFLLRDERAIAIELRLKGAQLREEDALRYLRLGDLASMGQLARRAVADLEQTGDGRVDSTETQALLQLVPKQSVEADGRIEALGRLVDAAGAGLGEKARPVLERVVEKRLEAVEAYVHRDFGGAMRLTDEAAGLLPGVAPDHAADFAELWKLEKDLAVGRARYEELNWTKPMLAMSEQLGLVLILELAFGVIFELPLVLALLGMAGLVTSKFLFRYQRHALVVCIIIAAVVTPTGDAVNLAMMAGPMLLCYELGVLAVWLIEKRRGKAIVPVQ